MANRSPCHAWAKFVLWILRVFFCYWGWATFGCLQSLTTAEMSIISSQVRTCDAQCPHRPEPLSTCDAQAPHKPFSLMCSREIPLHLYELKSLWPPPKKNSSRKVRHSSWWNTHFSWTKDLSFHPEYCKDPLEKHEGWSHSLNKRLCCDQLWMTNFTTQRLIDATFCQSDD